MVPYLFYWCAILLVSLRNYSLNLHKTQIPHYNEGEYQLEGSPCRKTSQISVWTNRWEKTSNSIKEVY